MNTVHSVEELRAVVATWRRAGQTSAFVPTMGNLHEGHITLLRKAREMATRSVVSIFVNPIQFGRGEDYARYPSTLDADKEKLEAAGLDLLFAPNLDELYPGGIEEDTRVTVPSLSNILCGQFRPGHFSGVATVVTKLLMNVQPDLALFGEKDYQQLLVIQRMVRDLLMPVRVLGQPIVREADGLAMSSRNAYLSADERTLAPLIFQTINRAADKLRARQQSVIAIETAGMADLAAAGFRPEYLSVRRASDLSPPQRGDTSLQVLVAAWLGSARLIDNVRVELDAPLALL